MPIKIGAERCASFFEIKSDGKVGISSAFKDPKVQYYNYDVYSGIQYEINLRNPVGQRVTKLLYHGQPVTPVQQIEVALNQYRGLGGGDYSMFSADKISKEVQIDMTELIGSYFADHPLVNAKQDKNFKIID